MVKLLKNQKIIIGVYTLFLLVTSIILISFSKSEIHLFINRHYSNFFDIFFRVVTTFGEDYFIVGVLILCLLISYRFAFIQLASYSISGLAVQFLKNYIFPTIVRPSLYFKGIYELRFVEGVEMHSHYSFPSGHTATAFALFFCFAVLVQKRWAKLFFIFCAILVGYSRMYLSQHFLIDVYAGSIIAVITVFLMFYLFGLIKNPKIDRPLFSFKKQRFK